MGFLGGGVGSGSASITNTLAFTPIINVGENNDADTSATQKAASTATATAKDELGLSASVGILGGNGGPSSLKRSGNDDEQPMLNDGFFNDGIKPMYIYIAGGLVALGGIGYLITKKKKK